MTRRNGLALHKKLKVLLELTSGPSGTGIAWTSAAMEKPESLRGFAERSIPGLKEILMGMGNPPGRRNVKPRKGNGIGGVSFLEGSMSHLGLGCSPSGPLLR